jgi:hypothetical protein
MAMTLLQLAKKILQEEKRALASWQIMQVAENKGYAKLTHSKVMTFGNPLSMTFYDPLGEAIRFDVRNNPFSVFVALGENPTRFILKSQMKKIRPGKQIQILENVNYIHDDFTNIIEVIATKGSIGTILSYQEYFTTTEERTKDSGYIVPKHHREWQHSGIEAGMHYPIRIDEVTPLSEDAYAALTKEFTIVDLSCKVDAIMIIPTKSFVLVT